MPRTSLDDVAQDWYFTWGFNQGYDNCYTVIHGTYYEARAEMTRRFGKSWGFQYESADAAGVDEFKLKLIN